MLKVVLHFGGRGCGRSKVRYIDNVVLHEPEKRKPLMKNIIQYETGQDRVESIPYSGTPFGIDVWTYARCCLELHRADYGRSWFVLEEDCLEQD